MTRAFGREQFWTTSAATTNRYDVVPSVGG